jgi:hypothetical protein
MLGPMVTTSVFPGDLSRAGEPGQQKTPPTEDERGDDRHCAGKVTEAYRPKKPPSMPPAIPGPQP